MTTAREAVAAFRDRAVWAAVEKFDADRVAVAAITDEGLRALALDAAIRELNRASAVAWMAYEEALATIPID